MRRSHDYAILRLIPDAARGEVVNIGVAVFTDHGIDVRLTPNLNKARALSAWVDVDSLRQLPQAIAASCGNLQSRDMQIFTLRGLFSPVTIDEALGRFVSRSADEYEARIAETLAAYVLPEAKITRRVSVSTSRLHHDLREWFRRHQLLAKDAEAIAKNKVVQRYPIAPNAGVYAEFALKNGVYRITETVDFRVKDVGSHKSNEAAAKAITLFEAKAALGHDTQRFAVVAARDYAAIQAQIDLLGRHADHVLIRDSAEDMNFYASTIARAAKVPELDFSA